MSSVPTEERTVLTTSATQLAQAREFVDQHVQRPERVALPQDGETGVLLPPELSHILTEAVKILAAGGTVTIGAMPENLTTTAAARLLGVSRPTLMKMISQGKIPAHKVGTHTRLRAEDVLVERDKRRAAQRAAFDALRALEDE